jgi:dTDP-4-dehydrorhamnose 3,5-epimerase
MVFHESSLKGAYVVEPEKQFDTRGFFARIFCEEEFGAHGLNPRIVQCSVSFNTQKGTLRGMHYQIPPHEEAKLVRCTAGAIHDVIIDLRPHSPTLRQWLAVDLTAENRRLLYIPQGFAHGFQTLVDHTEVFYAISDFYHPECARGIRWNDPAFQIPWPLQEVILSERDRTYPDLIPLPLSQLR